MMEFHVLGPGAIGSLFACHLQKAGFTTALITRSPSEDARLITLEENNPHQANTLETHGFKIHKSGPIQHLLVTVKAHQTEAALNSVAHRITENTLIILLQNGMGSWHAVERLFPNTPCVLATTTEGAYRAGDHHIVHAGRGTTWIGETTEQNRANALANAWNNLDLAVEYDPNILARLWQKLAINCAINPLTVLYDCCNGDLLTKNKALEDMERLCAEVEMVKHHVLEQSLDESLFEQAKTVANKTGNNVSSMLQDYRKGNPTEIEFITGYLVSKAKELGIEVPHNQRVLNAIREISF